MRVCLDQKQLNKAIKRERYTEPTEQHEDLYGDRNEGRILACEIIRRIIVPLYVPRSMRTEAIPEDLTRFNKIATQGAPQMAVDKEANSLSRVYSYYSKFNLRLFYV